ncbi:TonB protein C-terminal [Paenimyroides ummariense]|uniref:TonB protein C-terminal n=1 Tax=Paenimyroides ummariense TaxID=913024 RepID=A0A1I4WAI4_9FLAO|nr:energy transducer TonB [Paenimyroides ummariense]SFN10393.1 TonB protein C-terminal [Paenimyroides ummariense]
MKNTLLLILLAFSFQTNAQTVEASTTIPTNEYLDLLASNLEIPDAVQQKFANQDLNLTIVLTITKDGSVFNPKIQNDSLQLESNLKKAIEKLPKWNPKTEDGVAVVSRKAFNLSIFIPNKEIHTSTNEVATPEQGIEAFYIQFIRKFNAPKLSNNRDIEVYVAFSIEKDGSLTDIKIVESNAPSVNNEVIRVMKLMPKWNPATENGVPIRSESLLPIKIKVKINKEP